MIPQPALLTELAACAARHPFIADACAIPLEGSARARIGLAATLTDAGNAALHELGHARLAQTLRRHLSAQFALVALPRHWRFVRALPAGCPARAIRALFDTHEHGFVLLSEVLHDGALRYDLRVPDSLVHFRGHFPGLPILPGVVQVDWAVKLAAREFGRRAAVAVFERLKFTAPVMPGAVLTLTLAHDAARGRTRFAYTLGARDSASGTIAWRDAA